MTFLSFVLLLTIAMVILAFRHEINAVTVIVGLGLVVATIGATLSAIWLLKDKERIQRFSHWLSRTTNRFISWVTRGKKTNVVKGKGVLEFFEGLHDDYAAIRRESNILVTPFLWAIIANIFDVMLIWIAFWSLGFPLDAALLFIAFGLASIVSALAATPAGAGVYEAIMVTFLAASGVTPEVAIAGTLLARVVLLTGTVLFGYVFYQLTVMQHGKRPVNS